MQENFYLESTNKVDCFVISDHAHSTNLQTGHGFEFQETKHDEDHILKLDVTLYLRRKLKQLN